MRLQASVLALLVACGDGETEPPVDAAPILRLPIQFEVRGETPHLLAIRDLHDGTWTVLPTNATKMYATEATLRHQIVMVCGKAGSFRTQVEMRVRSDDAPFLFCFNNENPQPTFPITGQMLQAGQVSMSGSDESTTAPWTFDLMATAGPHDLVAFGDTMALIRPNLQITAATTIPTIDLAQGGVAYVTTTAFVTNREPDETTQTELVVLLENGLAEITRSGSALRELDPVLFGSTGFQFGTIAALTPTTRREASIDGTGTVMVKLLPRLSGITFADLGATWTALPVETAEVGYSVFTATNSVALNASGAYLAGDTALSIELDIPGFDAAWRVPATDRQHRFSVYDAKLSESSVFSAPQTIASRRSSGELHRIVRHDPKRAAQLLVGR
jgi:hypothetical protein